MTATNAAIWQTLLDARSAPEPATEDGIKDPRTPAQRCHDAFEDLGLRILRSGSLPERGGCPVTVLAITTLDQPVEALLTATRTGTFALPEGSVVTEHGHPITANQLRDLGDDVSVIRVLLGSAGQVLFEGHRVREGTPAQRRAATARDRGCSFPGCSRPASWCQLHHVREWKADEGPTDIDNLTLVCSYHHREFTRQGWTSRMTNGVPYWVPPAWIDSDQKPRRNRTNHCHLD